MKIQKYNHNVSNLSSGLLSEDKKGDFIECSTDIWETKNVEDYIFKSFYALHGTDYSIGGPSRNFTFRDCVISKTIGCYFPPKGRRFYRRTIDIRNDGLPGVICLSGVKNFIPTSTTPYPDLSTVVAFPIKNMPKGVRALSDGPKYKVIVWSFFENGVPKVYIPGVFMNESDGDVRTIVSYLSIDEKNERVVFAQDKRFVGGFQINGSFMKELFSVTASAYADSKNLWSVDIIEPVFGEKRITTHLKFGVYEEHIKSLFYARNSPLTDAGRKRPIQHWVSSHQRRIKNGIDINVKKHLRGITRFNMFGYNFIISSPNRESIPELEKQSKLVQIGLSAPTIVEDHGKETMKKVHAL